MPLYAFGSNASGQLGIGSTKDTNVPTLCSFADSQPGAPKKIVAGGNHTLVHFNDGTVYYSGSSRDSKLQPHCLSPPIVAFRKTHVPAQGDEIKLCSAWWDGSVFVEMNDIVCTAGSGPKGEMGTGKQVTSTGLQEVPNFPPSKGKGCGGIVDVDGGVDHIVIVLADGTVWGWGNGRKGQLTGSCEIVWAPRKFEGLSHPVTRAVCGRDFTFIMHKSGTYGVLGTKKWDLRAGAPDPICDWKDVGASWGSIFVLKEDGSVDSWGRNDRGQLVPPGLPDIEKLAVGSEHVVALSKDGKVLSWGWGEHGNCGVDVDENGDVKGRWNELPIHPSEKVVGVGAGCATSFFWTVSSSSWPK